MFENGSWLWHGGYRCVLTIERLWVQLKVKLEQIQQDPLSIGDRPKDWPKLYSGWWMGDF